MNYIILDLEWNQSNTGLEEEVERLPFEIIEMGAIKMDESLLMISEFNELVKPVVYREMHHITSKLIHMQMQELERGRAFADVAEQFLEWCGEDYMICTWGSSDLTELQRNMRFHGMADMAEGPIAFLDVQKLFSIAYEDRKTRRSLEYAIDFLGIEKDIPFHRAFSDAYYATKVLTSVIQKDRAENAGILKNVSYDAFVPPKDRDSEIKAQFDTYVKYISRCFPDKKAAFADKEVSSSKCYLCHRNLRKRIRWFSINGKQYYSVAYCEKHGYLKGKIRFRKAPDGQLYVIKTNKLITKEEMEVIAQKREHAIEQRKKHRHKEG